MSVSGSCEICTRGEVKHTCNRCANLVCERHFDRETGYCVECVSEIGRGGTENTQQDDELPDGVDTYEF